METTNSCLILPADRIAGVHFTPLHPVRSPCFSAGCQFQPRVYTHNLSDLLKEQMVAVEKLYSTANWQGNTVFAELQPSRNSLAAEFPNG